MSQKKEDNKDKKGDETTITPYFISFKDGIEESDEAPMVKYPKINAALGMLDRFLSKNLVLIFSIYALTVTICGGGLLMNNVVFSNASGTEGTTGTAPIELNTWLYSIIAVFTFFLFLACVYLISRKRFKASKPVPSK